MELVDHVIGLVQDNFSLNPSTPTVVMWVQQKHTVPDRGISRHL